MTIWDQQYASAVYKYGTAPNAFLVTQRHRIQPGGSVLVPGDGEGRNGVWLAEQGLQVTAVDSSAVGLDKLRTLAADRHVAVQTIHADLQEWTPEPESFDAIALIYVHLPASSRAAIHRALIAGLRPGGLLILEAFHPTQLGRSSGGPRDVTMLYTLEQLRGDVSEVPGVAVIELEAWEGEVLLDEGPGHQGAAVVTRLVLQRTAAPHFATAP
jgi:SAM-dependent methyltransferase